MTGLDSLSLPGKNSRADEIYDALRQAIISGELEPNDRLLEEAIAKTVSASRTPVREALHRLEMDGLVRQSSRGAVVTDYSAEELAELCVVREALESLSARLAAESRSESQVALIRAQLENYLKAVEDGGLEGVLEANRLFHEAIWQAAHNHYLVRQLDVLRGLVERLDTTTLNTRERQLETASDHTAITEAIEAGDAARASELAQQHFAKATTLRILHKRTLQMHQRRSWADAFR